MKAEIRKKQDAESVVHLVAKLRSFSQSQTERAKRLRQMLDEALYLFNICDQAIAEAAALGNEAMVAWKRAERFAETKKPRKKRRGKK
jgi:hypothetical protein